MNEEKKHSLLSRMAYGAADIYGGGAFVVISTFYTVFLTKAQGMPAAMAGTIPLIGKVWDAVTDPIMGNICDRTKSKFGAKRFYILVGSLLSALMAPPRAAEHFSITALSFSVIKGRNVVLLLRASMAPPRSTPEKFRIVPLSRVKLPFWMTTPCVSLVSPASIAPPL